MLGSQTSAPLGGRVAALGAERPRKGLFQRRAQNRRVVVQRRSLLVALADALAALGRGMWRVVRWLSKLLLAAGFLAAALWGGRWAVEHVLASPRFAITEVLVSPTEHVDRAEILALAGVAEEGRLLAVDTDRVAARIASHPWVAAARVRRQLPSALQIEVTERRASAVVAMGGLYLVDEHGRPFKRATMAEADGLPAVTGIGRAHYVSLRDASEAAFREALTVLGAYQSRSRRPPVGEVHIDPRFGFSLFLFEGGAEIRLGRGEYGKKLARLDRILEALEKDGSSGLRAVRVIHLDAPDGTRVPVSVQVPGS